jgi:SNF2 family DNA or RNA helicase
MRLSLADDHLILDFPYDAMQVAEVRLLKGAKWDKVGRVWRAPVSSLNECRDFAAAHEFTIDSDVLLLTLPAHKNPSRRIYVHTDGFIYLAFAYDRVAVTSAKQIPGITWDKKTHAWKAPITSVDEVVRWGETFDVPVDAAVRQEASVVRGRLETTMAASRATDAAICIPDMLGELLPYQRAGVAYALASQRCFIADEMGLGKSVQAAATIELLASQGEDVFPGAVVCPPNLVVNWQAEWWKFFPNRNVQIVTNRKEFPADYDIVVIGYSNISTWVRQLSSHKSYIFDESHYCKTPTAQRTKVAKRLARSAGVKAPILLLTGTPVTNRPAEYAAQLDILGQIDKFGGTWGFYRRYCDAFKDKWGQWHLEGHSNLEELNDRLRSTCYIRRTKPEVMKELPPIVHSPVLVAGASPVMKEYAKAEADIVQYLVDRARAIAKEMGLNHQSAAVRARFRAEASQHLVKISVLRRIAAKAKMAAAHEWVTAHTEAGHKVVVAAHHRDIVDELAREHGGLKIQGGMNVHEVEAAKAEFQNGDTQVMVLSIQAAKSGHTLTAAQDILFVEQPWTPADVDQTVARLHRIGQQGSVTATYMLTVGTIDQQIYDLINSKRSVVNQATEGVTVGASASTSDLVMDLAFQTGKT